MISDHRHGPSERTTSGTDIDADGSDIWGYHVRRGDTACGFVSAYYDSCRRMCKPKTGATIFCAHASWGESILAAARYSS